MLESPTLLVWLMSTHILFSIQDLKTFSLLEIALRERPLEPKMLLMHNAQLLSITLSNSWREENATLSMMDTHTCHSIFPTLTLLASNILGVMSQLQRTIGFQTTDNSHLSISQDKCPLTLLKVLITLPSRHLMDHHTVTSTQATIHWKTMSTFLKKE